MPFVCGREEPQRLAREAGSRTRACDEDASTVVLQKEIKSSGNVCNVPKWVAKF
jgi:hypothetical protein